MKFIPNSVTRTIARQILMGKKNSPHIFFAGGIAGIVTSTVLACRATLKVDKTLDEIKTDIHDVKETGKTEVVNEDEVEIVWRSDQDYYKDLMYVYGRSVVKIGRLYGPSIILGSASIAALTGSHVQLTRRNSALTATLAAVSQAFNDYRGRVQRELGKERELELYRCEEDVEYEEGNKKELVKVSDPNKHSIYARCFDESSREWRKSSELNRMFIQCQQNYHNHLLQARGHVFLNEVYDSLGLERSQAGSVVGWIIGGGR